MNKFLKLHNCDDNSTIIVNANNIITVEKDNDAEHTVIYCINENVVHVYESPEKIFDMLQK